MDAAEVRDLARQHGAELSVSPTGNLRWRAPGPLPEELRERLAQSKYALLALLSDLTEDEQERFEERAGIAEHEGRLSRLDAERLAWEELQAARAPKGPGLDRSCVITQESHT